MNKKRFAKIIILNSTLTGKNSLIYSIPENIKAEKGEMVIVPLRKAKKKGIIIEITTQKPDFETKDILEKVEKFPPLDETRLKIANYIAEYYFCALEKAIKLFIPSGFINKKKIKAPIWEIQNYKIEERLELNEEQKKALELILTTKKRVTLLHGITGSGKTEIYRRITESVINKQMQCLILIPEIALTPQTKRTFEKKFGKNIAIIHSKLSPTQKENYWKLIAEKKLNIIIGSRSALFAPFQGLGLIIIDEEHEDSYKQNQTPRYHAINIAKKMAELTNCKLILGSATPSLESYHSAKNGSYQLVNLRERIKNNNFGDLPIVKIVDMKEELKKRNFSIFSEELQLEILNCLNKNEQSILFLNRRGAASAVICRDCGHVEKCENCAIAFTFHSKVHVEKSIWEKERLICHHCGKISIPPKTCGICGSHLIKNIGTGTQKIEDESCQIFKKAKIIRADKDTTQNKDSFENIYDRVKNKEVDILIGTQMIAKGLHLPNVTLVGVIIADSALLIPDYRSAEKTFQILTQVAGRSGREKPGKVIIQTYLPDHYAISSTIKHDYLAFYEKELQERKKYNFPPFSHLIKIIVESKDNLIAQEDTKLLAEKMLKYKKEQKEICELIDTIDTYPAILKKFKNKYRYILLLTGKNPNNFLKKYLAFDLSLQKKLKSDIKIDVDPTNSI